MSSTSLFKLEDPKSLRSGLHGIFTEMQTGISDLIDKLPEQFRPQFKALKAKTDEVLTGLASQPSEQVPAAEQANWGLRSLAYALMSAHDQYQSLVRTLGDMSAKYSGLATEVQSLHGLKQQTEKGELLTKEQAQKSVDEAVAATKKELNERFTLLGKRRSELQSDGLPLPEDAVLEGDDKAFGELRGKAKTRFTKLGELGLASELNSADLCPLVYGSESEYLRTVKVAEKSGAKAGSGVGERRGEPLLGGGGDAPKVRRGF